MTLDKALHILAEIHTRQDVRSGFCILVGASPETNAPWIKPSDYVAAWKAVREQLNLPTKPESTGN
jgi:hypothetical protein